MNNERKIKKLMNFSDDSSFAMFEELSDIQEELATLNAQEIRKGDKGDKGDPGENANEERIINEVLAKIPKPKDGKTPTKGELISLIKPLIPKVSDGIDADEEYVISQVLKRIPKTEFKTDTGLEIKKKLLALSEEDKLKLKDLVGFEELIRSIEKFGVTKKSNPIPYSGITTTFFALNGVNMGRAKNINFVSGSVLGVVLNGDTATITIPTGGSGGTVSSTDSITGQGSTLDPIHLVNDSTSPGNSKYYGTNGSGTKGFFNLPAIFTNTVASIDPTPNDDNTLGYGTTSRWFNRLTGISWVCNTAATGAADWRRELFDLAKSNMGAGIDPTGNDDDSLGYKHGSFWYNIVTNRFFLCISNATAAAVWIQLTNIVTNVDPTVNDDISSGHFVGQYWFNSSTQTSFISTNSTTGAAVWVPVGGNTPSGYTVVPSNYGITVNANANDHIVFTGSTGASVVNLSALTTIGDMVVVSDLDRIAASNQITLDAGIGNVIVSNMSNQLYPISTNGESVTLQRVTATQFKLI